MLKTKKRKKSKREEKLENSEDKITAVKNISTQEGNLAEKIKQMSEGLFYISETDAEITVFEGKPADAVTKEEILAQTGNSTDKVVVVEKSFNDFFAPLTEIQDWYGDEEKETTRKYTKLKQLLENNLRDLKCFKVGKVQLDIYVVGLDAENKLLGIKTKAVET